MADECNSFAGKVQRLNYSLGQYLEAEDFKTEQCYHICMRRRGNKAQYTAGVLDGGFMITKTADKTIRIGAGIAVDGEGRELIILTPIEEDLSSLQPNKAYVVTIAYDEKEDNPEISEDNLSIKTRITETPVVKITVEGGTIQEDEIILAKISLDTNGIVIDDAISLTVRQDAKTMFHGNVAVDKILNVQEKIGIGITNPMAQLHIATGPDAALGVRGRGMLILGGVNTQHLVLDSNEIMSKDSGTTAGTLHLQGEGGLTSLGGSLSVKGNMSLDATLTVKDKIGIGTTNPKSQLHIAAAAGTDVKLNTPGSGMLILGDENGEHLAFDNNEIMAKISGTNAGKLHLQHEGGGTYLGGSLSVKKDVTLDAALIVKEKIGIGTTSPKAQLHIEGGSDVELKTSGSGMLILGDENGEHLAFDNNEIMAKKNGATANRLHLQNDGGSTFLGGDLEFSRKTNRQMINLWGDRYGIGIQNGTQYYRTSKNFAWFQDGIHHDSEFNPGPEGKRLMALNNPGDLILSARTNPTGDPAKSKCRALVDYIDGFLVINFGNDFKNGVRTDGDFVVKGSAMKPDGGSWTRSSDKKLKKNIKPIRQAYQKLLKLQGVSFEWKEPENHGNLTGTQMGLVAQEVEKVFPEWVDTDADGYKLLTIRGFEGLMVEAFRALTTQVEQLQTKIMTLEKNN